jgi:hypothetical protein
LALALLLLLLPGAARAQDPLTGVGGGTEVGAIGFD